MAVPNQSTQVIKRPAEVGSALPGFHIRPEHFDQHVARLGTIIFHRKVRQQSARLVGFEILDLLLVDAHLERAQQLDQQPRHSVLRDLIIQATLSKRYDVKVME
jgi:hypothetical protein